MGQGAEFKGGLEFVADAEFAEGFLQVIVDGGAGEAVRAAEFGADFFDGITSAATEKETLALTVTEVIDGR